MKPFVFCLSENINTQRTPILTVENAKKMRSGLIVLHNDEEVGAHNTNENEELIVVLEGKATVEIDGRVFSEVKSGSAAYIPSHTLHNVKNRADSKLRYIYIVSQT
jgi:quercetin dioxygenase-like cupin family protein